MEMWSAVQEVWLGEGRRFEALGTFFGSSTRSVGVAITMANWNDLPRCDTGSQAGRFGPRTVAAIQTAFSNAKSRRTRTKEKLFLFTLFATSMRRPAVSRANVVAQAGPRPALLSPFGPPFYPHSSRVHSQVHRCQLVSVYRSRAANFAATSQVKSRIAVSGTRFLRAEVPCFLPPCFCYAALRRSEWCGW